VFLPLAAQVATGLGASSLTRVTVPHSIASADPQAVEELIAGIADDVSAAVFDGALAQSHEGKRAGSVSNTASPVQRLEAAGDDEATMHLYRIRGWADGLPIVLPTESRVETMLGPYAPHRLLVLGQMPPSGAFVTLESLAVAAVMAGCAPSYFPVVVAGMKAMLTPEFNLLRLQTTTSAGTPMLIVSGPMSRTLGINSGADVLGAYFRPNITIGRAIRLAMIGIGGASPLRGDMSTLGQSAKVGLCVAENIDTSPFEALHVDAGFAPEDTVVGVIGVSGQMNVNDFVSRTASDLLRTISRTIAVPGLYNVQIGGGPLLLLGPEHATILAAAGFGRAELQRWLFEHARVPIDAFSDELIVAMRARRPGLSIDGGIAGAVPIADDPTDIVVLVAGGSGSHSVFMPTVRGRVVFARVEPDGR
jgi:hypothetical protein